MKLHLTDRGVNYCHTGSHSVTCHALDTSEHTPP